MAKVIVALSMSVDGFIAGRNDGGAEPLGEGGMRLFDWLFNGDSPNRRYAAAARRGVRVPPFKLAGSSTPPEVGPRRSARARPGLAIIQPPTCILRCP